MKEVRTIKLVEQVEVKFIASDGKEFVGDDAEKRCQKYEDRIFENLYEHRFNQLKPSELYIPTIDRFVGECQAFKIVLNSYYDYQVVCDYFTKVWRKELDYIYKPENYPCTKIYLMDCCEYVDEYDIDLLIKEVDELRDELCDY